MDAFWERNPRLLLVDGTGQLLDIRDRDAKTKMLGTKVKSDNLDPKLNPQNA